MSQFTVNEYCRALWSEVVERHGKHEIHFDDERTSRALTAVVESLWSKARQLFDQGNIEQAAVLAEWLDSIAPNPNTGSFDGFWQAFRSLQPLELGVKNPRYVRLDATLDHEYRQRTLAEVPAEWKDIVRETGELLNHAA